MQIVTIPGCRNGIAVTKIVKYNKFGCIENADYSDALGGTGWNEGDCTAYDYEKVLLCSDDDGIVMLESFGSTTDSSQARTTRYTVLSTGLAYTGDIADLYVCPKYDYEKLILCNDDDELILMESWADISNPNHDRTITYTVLATGLPYEGPIAELHSCDEVYSPVSPHSTNSIIATPTALSIITTDTVKSLTLISADGATITVGGVATVLTGGVSYTWNQGTNVNMDVTNFILGIGSYDIIWEK